MRGQGLGPWVAGALVVGNMLGVGILLTPRLVADALPDTAAYLGLWLLGGLVAAAGAAVYAELGTRLPEAGGDVVFQEAGLGRAVALGSGLLMFVAAFAGSIAAISVAIGTWQVPTLLGLPVPQEGVLAKGVGLGVIALLTGVNLVGLRVGAAVRLVSTALPLVCLVGLGAWSLATGSPPPPPPEALVRGDATALMTAFSGVYYAYAGWPAVVYLAGEVRDPARTLHRAMLGGTVVVTAVYVLLNAAFLQAFGAHGLRSTFEAGSALVMVVLGEGAAWVMAAVVLVALLASVNATIMGGARVGLALAQRGGLPAVFGRLDARGLPRAALLLQAGVAALLVLSGTFEQILEGTVLAMLAIGCLTVLSLVLIRRRDLGPPPAYRASLWPLSPLVYVAVCGGFLALNVGSSLRLPAEGAGVMGLVFLGLVVAFFGARLRGRPRR